MIETARWRKAATREQCIALYPGSNPGRASSLRCLPRRSSKSEGRASQLRLGEPVQIEACGAGARRAKAGARRAKAGARRAKAGKMPVDGAHKALSRLRNLV